MSKVKIAALQLSTLPLSNKKLRKYLENAKKNGAKVVVLGEYVLNNFFKELVRMQKNMIKVQSLSKIEALEKFAIEFDLHIVAPIVLVEKDKIYKAIGHFAPNKTQYKNQEFLINYEHWDEESFFDNSINTTISIMTFSINGINFSVINGYEIHFDPVWIEIVKQDTDVVLIPTASTFGSNQRWTEILKTRAFLNSMYILRVNRVGNYEGDGNFWNFYGETYFINPDGFVEDMLYNSEGILMADVEIRELRDVNSSWRFKEQLKKRNLI